MLLLSLLQAWVAAAVVTSPVIAVPLLILVCSKVFFAILVPRVIQASLGSLLVVIEKPMPVDETVTDPMILGLCLTAMAGLLGYQQYQLIQLRSGVDSAAEKTSLEAILARLNRVDERLDAVDGHHLVSNEDFRSGQQALSNRIDAAQAAWPEHFPSIRSTPTGHSAARFHRSMRVAPPDRTSPTEPLQDPSLARYSERQLAVANTWATHFSLAGTARTKFIRHYLRST